jgi:hypothetical protein
MARKQQAFYRTVFTVEGAGKFPMDMLRYEAASPLREGDSNAMERRESRTISLYKFSADPKVRPNESRWASFGWTVKEASSEQQQ